MPFATSPSAPASRSTPAIDYCRRFCDHSALFDEPALHCNGRGVIYRAALRGTRGSGWMEVRQLFGGLGIGRMDYRLVRTEKDTVPDYETSLGFGLLLSGDFSMRIPDIGISTRVRGGQMFLRKGRFGQMHCAQPAGQVMRGVSIDLPQEMIDGWRNEPPGRLDNLLSGLVRGTGPLCRSFSCGSHILGRIATRMLAVQGDTVGGDLLLESLALDFLANILSLDLSDGCGVTRPGARRWAAIDEAVDILNVEWIDPPTIALLARRVGLNACYLKSGFRRRVGMTIGAYVRKQRMEVALRMLECDGCTVLQAASAVGYTNPSHFSAAFRQFHGRLPSQSRQKPHFCA